MEGGTVVNFLHCFRRGYLTGILLFLPLFFCFKEPSVVSTPEKKLPEGIVELDTATFDTAIMVQDRIAVVDFYLSTCSSCLQMDNIFSDLAALYGDRIYFAKVECSKNSSLAIEYMLGSVPTFIFFKSGERVRDIVGVTTEDSLAAVIDSLLDLP
jgi:thioredoxin 1